MLRHKAKFTAAELHTFKDVNKCRNVRKRTFGHVRTAKIKISLRIRTVCSGSSLAAFWIAKNAKFLHADNED